jgi:hypothetical protein
MLKKGAYLMSLEGDTAGYKSDLYNIEGRYIEAVYDLDGNPEEIAFLAVVGKERLSAFIDNLELKTLL